MKKYISILVCTVAILGNVCGADVIKKSIGCATELGKIGKDYSDRWLVSTYNCCSKKPGEKRSFGELSLWSGSKRGYCCKKPLTGREKQNVVSLNILAAGCCARAAYQGASCLTCSTTCSTPLLCGVTIGMCYCCSQLPKAQEVMQR